MIRLVQINKTNLKRHTLYAPLLPVQVELRLRAANADAAWQAQRATEALHAEREAAAAAEARASRGVDSGYGRASRWGADRDAGSSGKDRGAGREEISRSGGGGGHGGGDGKGRERRKGSESPERSRDADREGGRRRSRWGR